MGIVPSSFRQFMKKKVTEKQAPELYSGAYITFMDYFATGEGRTLEINFCYADTPDEAKQKHLDRFYPNDKDAQEYFGHWVEVAKLNSKRAKTILGETFKEGVPGIPLVLAEAGCEFYWKFHFNYS
jgi:hypothetical protein